MSILWRPRVASLCLAFPLLALSARPALAQTPATAGSSAYGEWINLQVLPLLGGPVQVLSGPLPVVSGTAPASFDTSSDLASIGVTCSPLGKLLQTGLLQVDASSQAPNAPVAEADATIAAVNARIAGILSLLGLTADAVSSRAFLSCPCVVGKAVVTGSSVLANARLNGLAVDARPAPNTVLLDLVGLRVVLNEQIFTVTPDGQTDFTVNAVHVSLHGMACEGVGLISGDIVLAQSHAHMACAFAE
jgi:hypothetical protein